MEAFFRIVGHKGFSLFGVAFGSHYVSYYFGGCAMLEICGLGWMSEMSRCVELGRDGPIFSGIDLSSYCTINREYIIY